MLLGIKQRAERLAETGGLPTVNEGTPTPEVFIPLDEAIPDYGLTLEGVHLDITGSTLDTSFPAGCTGEPPACAKARDGFNLLSVTFTPRDLPEGNMLAYKGLPPVSVAMHGGAPAPYSLSAYDNASHSLTLGFEVPESAAVFGLQWSFFITTGGVPELQSEPWRIALHLAAEATAALMLIVSPGYFAQLGQWALVAMFAVLLFGATFSVMKLLKE